MKPRLHRLFLVMVLAVSGLTATFATGLQHRQLFHLMGGSRNSAGDRMFMGLVEQPTTFRAAFARVDVALFDGDEFLLLNPFPDVSMEAVLYPVGFSGSLHRAWFGKLQNFPGTAVFIINGDRISGKISCSLGTFEIFPLGKGECIIVEHQLNKFPGCLACEDDPATDSLGDPAGNPVEGDVAVYESTFSEETSSTADDPASDRIRVIVAYTTSAQSKTQTTYGRTMQEHIDLAIAESNQGYANSGVDSRIELACLYETDYVETYAISKDVDAFHADGDGKADEVHVLRADFDADMCSLITDGRDIFWCGDSYGFDYSSRENMFQATNYRCVTGNFSFIHEFGHGQGCRHNDDTNLEPFAYGHGLRNDVYWYTIMALANATDAVRLNYWSNPEIVSPVEPFAPMGTPVNGEAFANDCRSALNDGDDTVINHETTPTSSSAPTNHAFEDDEYADKLVSDTLSVANFTASTGSTIQFRAGTAIVLQSGFQAMAGSKFRASLTHASGDPSDL